MTEPGTTPTYDEIEAIINEPLPEWATRQGPRPDWEQGLQDLADWIAAATGGPYTDEELARADYEFDHAFDHWHQGEAA
ncbi:MAG: hypothetical protein LBR33_07650 [Propionibacteriaceae bacterium]|jgi:hypothetical protein|nr:hypothetical protein [Propionibacteriaceae bacterium]